MYTVLSHSWSDDFFDYFGSLIFSKSMGKHMTLCPSAPCWQPTGFGLRMPDGGGDAPCWAGTLHGLAHLWHDVMKELTTMTDTLSYTNIHFLCGQTVWKGYEGTVQSYVCYIPFVSLDEWGSFWVRKWSFVNWKNRCWGRISGWPFYVYTHTHIYSAWQYWVSVTKFTLTEY